MKFMLCSLFMHYGSIELEYGLVYIDVLYTVEKQYSKCTYYTMQTFASPKSALLM